MLRHGTGLLCLLLLAAPLPAQTRIEVIKDNSIVLYPGEEHLNAGGRDRIRIKGNQHIVAMAFDTRPLRGKVIREATLVYPKGEHAIDQVTISTIQCHWDEETSSALDSGQPRVEGWGRSRVRFPAMSGGNAFSLVCHAKSEIKNNAYHWKVDPDLVHACASGVAYGLAIHETSSDYSRNPTVLSRENRGPKPVLMVRTGGRAREPLRPGSLQVIHTGDPDSMRLLVKAPPSGLAYDVRVSGKIVPRWNIPFIRPGSVQVIPIRDMELAPGRAVTVTVNAINRAGRRSSDTTVTTRIPQRLEPTCPKIPDLPPASGMIQGLSVIPITDRYDYNGQPVGSLPRDYLTRNAVFDGRTIRLQAARGEVVSFQALIKGKGRATAQCRMPGMRTDCFRALYVNTPAGRVPDPLVAFDELELDPAHATPVCVDIYIPFDATARTVTGSFILSDRRQLPINLTILPFSLPRQATFLCEMNSYGLPDHVRDFYRLQEIAYDHRVHCNILHYSHHTAAPGARQCTLDMRLENGQRMDEKRYNSLKPGDRSAYWDDFITAFDPYLSGECFKGGHRGPVPAPGFYLTFHESWPLNVRSYFNGSADAYEAFKDKPEYASTFVNILKDFIRTARKQEWTRTGFQVYLNNKGRLDDPARAPWILDEPTSYWDFRALAFYGDLVRQARGSACPVQLDYRIDISRPQFDRGELEKKSDLWVVNMGAFRNYPRLLRDRSDLYGEKLWVYGSSNKPQTSNRAILAWALEAYRGGARGLVPWQTVNRDGSALSEGDQLGLFIFDPELKQNGRPAIHHSMRLKAYRRAQQDIEYLNLLRQRYKLTRGQLHGFMDHYLKLNGELVKANAADAGTMTYSGLSPEAFRRLRAAAGALLSR